MVMTTGLLLALVLSLAQVEGRDPATFARRTAEFETVAAKRAAASAPAEQSRLALEWLRALRAVLKAIPIEQVDGPHHAWVKANDELIIYSEPAGEWLIGQDVLDRVYREHATSAAADEIAWLAATNGLPGECEGYIPCYAAGLDLLYGEYLRRQPRGAYRSDAADRVSESLQSIFDHLLKDSARAEYFDAAGDCDDLLRGARPLRAALAGASAKTAAIALVDRLIGLCAKK